MSSRSVWGRQLNSKTMWLTGQLKGLCHEMNIFLRRRRFYFLVFINRYFLYMRWQLQRRFGHSDARILPHIYELQDRCNFNLSTKANFKRRQITSTPLWQSDSSVTLYVILLKFKNEKNVEIVWSIFFKYRKSTVLLAHWLPTGKSIP